MNSPTRFMTLIPMVALIMAAGCGHDEAKRADAQLETLTVTTVEVEAVSDVKPIDVRGVVRPARQAEVSSRAMGPVVALRVDAGSVVSKGQVLLEIQPQASQGQLSQARGALAQAQAALAQSKRNFERYQALHAENASSELELDVARMQYEQARGAVAQAEGAVSSASSVASESEVRAPFAARVIETLVEVGDLAAPGRPLVRIESLADKQIWLTVRARDAGRIGIGDELAVRFDARPDFGAVDGTVVEIGPSADSTTHTLTVKVDLGKVEIPSGFSGRTTIEGDVTERLVIPVSAVHYRGGLELVVVRAADGTARTRAVTTGGDLADEKVEILSGLDYGDLVVVDAPGPVADGTPLELAR
jgi:RND family efflux transporter MFP subunit